MFSDAIRNCTAAIVLTLPPGPGKAWWLSSWLLNRTPLLQLLLLLALLAAWDTVPPPWELCAVIPGFGVATKLWPLMGAKPLPPLPRVLLLLL